MTGFNNLLRYISIVETVPGQADKYKLTAFKYERDTFSVISNNVVIDKSQLVTHIKYQRKLCMNASVNGSETVTVSELTAIKLQKIIKTVRWLMELNYGTGVSLSGHCIEASELIVELCNRAGISNAKSVEGWNIYDIEDYGTTRPYDEHTWVEVGDYYVDVTADQFNPGMYLENEYPGIIFHKERPKSMVLDEPTYLIDEYDC